MTKLVDYVGSKGESLADFVYRFSRRDPCINRTTLEMCREACELAQDEYDRIVQTCEPNMNGFYKVKLPLAYLEHVAKKYGVFGRVK